MSLTRKINQVILSHDEFRGMLRAKAAEVLGISPNDESTVYFRNAQDGSFVITIDPPLPPAAEPVES